MTEALSVTRRSISSRAARRLVEAAIAAAEADGKRIAVTIVDVAGDVVALGRMDGVSPAIIEFATDKAYTAAMVDKSTKAFGERMTSAPDLSLGLSTRRRMLAWEGGLPIIETGAVIGGIGVSGAAGPEDAGFAAAALAAIGLS